MPELARGSFERRWQSDGGKDGGRAEERME